MGALSSLVLMYQGSVLRKENLPFLVHWLSTLERRFECSSKERDCFIAQEDVTQRSRCLFRSKYMADTFAWKGRKRRRVLKAMTNNNKRNRSDIQEDREWVVIGNIGSCCYW